MVKYIKNMTKKMTNLKLETKLLLSMICINILFASVCFFGGMEIVLAQYDRLLYQSMQTSSALVSHEFYSRIEELITLSNIVRADTTVQSILDQVDNPGTGYGANYYSELYVTLQQHYLEYRHGYLKFVAVSCPRFVAYTYGYIKDRPSPERLDTLVDIAEKGDGSAVWVTDYMDEEYLYLVREIKKIENLRLNNLGTFIAAVDMDMLVEEVSQVSRDYEGSCWVLYYQDNLVYASPELTEDTLQQIQEEIKTYGIVTVNGKKYFAIRGAMEGKEWSDYIHLVSYEEVANSQKDTLRIYLLLLFAALILSCLILHVVVRRVTKHIDLLVMKMRAFGKDSENPVPSPYDYSARSDEIGMLHRQFDNMAGQIRTLVVENYRQQLLTKDAQLKTLESQMNPHFLYNTLDTINWRAKAIGEKQIALIAESLGHFLRMTLNKKSENFSLREEIAIIRYYMTIQQQRFDNRLQFIMNVPECYQDAMVPKLSIQPLLENAVHYALEQITDDCQICLTCCKSKDNLEIYVKNSGSEFEEDLLEKLRIHEIREKGLGIALLNIQERIQLLFGEKYGLRFYNEEDYAVVKMEIPYIPVKGENTDAKDDHCGR